MTDRKPVKAGQPMQDAFSSSAGGTLGRDERDKIAQSLRHMYDGYVNEGIPSHLLDILDRLPDSGAGETD